MGLSIRWYVSALLGLGLVGCHLDDVLKVPSPAGVSSSTDLASPSGADAVYADAKSTMYNAIYGTWYSSLTPWMGLLSDEFEFAGFASYAYNVGPDARRSAAFGVYSEPSDGGWSGVLAARSDVVDALPGLKAYEPASSRYEIGEAYALIGYSEIFLAEGFCSGTPLSQVNPKGGVQYGQPLTDDSLLGVAEADFDSAIANAAGSDTTLDLARVGLGRALVDRGQLAAAADTVRNVPAGFVFNSELAPSYNFGTNGVNMYAAGTLGPYNAVFTVADGKGTNGLNFLTANDPRLTFNTQYQTLDGAYGGAVPGIFYLPTKFAVNLSYIPLATGIEAALIQAEAALSTHDTTTWLADLNALRNSGCTIAGTDTTCNMGSGQVAGQTAGLPSLVDPGSDTARVSVMFRERAFWLFGTGTRLGDMRRLIRQYGRDQSVVFPVGVYPNGSNPYLPSPIPTYGTDVDLTLPTAAGLAGNGAGGNEQNLNYRGCLTPTTTA